jgi:diamine N-acetyltransferase
MSAAGIEWLALPALEPEPALAIGRTLARIDPWATLGYCADTLARGLTATHPDLVRHLALRDGETLGLVTVRYPWLRGAYIELFAVLPQAQDQGVGEALLEHVEERYRGRTANLWLLVSGFNDRARRFYERHGFGTIGTIPDLVLPGADEILMRKRL